MIPDPKTILQTSLIVLLSLFIINKTPIGGFLKGS